MRFARRATRSMDDLEASDDCSDCSTIGNNIQRLALSPEADNCSECLPFDIYTAASLGDVTEIHSINDGVDVCNSGGWTALMYAAYYGHPSVVEALLDIGWNPETRNLSCRTGLILASMCGNDDIVLRLLNRGALLDGRDNRDWNALFHATHLGHHSTVELLLQWGSDPNARDCNGYTPVIIAAMEGHELIMQHLLQYGGDVLVKTKAGDTTRHLANINGYTKLVSLIDSHLLSKHFDRAMPSLQDGPARLEKLITRKGGESKKHHGFSERRKTSLPNNTLAWSEDRKVNTPSSELLTFLASIGVAKYYDTFVKEDVDLQVFLSLTDSDLKEIGISLLGPRRKMTSAIARWHSGAPLLRTLEQVYADKLETEMQEMGIHLHRALSRIEVVEKQCDQERQLRSIVESCLMQERAFVCEILKLCRDVEKSMGVLCSNSATLQKYTLSANFKAVTDPVILPINAMCFQIDAMIPTIKEMVARATSRLHFIDQQAAPVSKVLE